MYHTIRTILRYDTIRFIYYAHCIVRFISIFYVFMIQNFVHMIHIVYRTMLTTMVLVSLNIIL